MLECIKKTETLLRIYQKLKNTIGSRVPSQMRKDSGRLRLNIITYFEIALIWCMHLLSFESPRRVQILLNEVLKNNEKSSTH